MLMIKNLSSGGYGSNCYFVSNGIDSVIIDPSVGPESLGCGEYASVFAVLLTHTHVDHLFGLDRWNQRNIPIYVGKEEAVGLTDSEYNVSELFGDAYTYSGPYQTVEPDEILQFGSLKIKAIHTPGHTKGHMCYLIEDNLFSGDLIFAGGGYGRFDFKSGDRETLFESIHKVFQYDFQNIYSGHGVITTKNKEIIYYS